MSDIRVCRACNAPLVPTLEYANYEFTCMRCGEHEGILGVRLDATAELVAELDWAIEAYRMDLATRTSVPYRPPRRVGDPDVTTPVCNGCGATPPEGTGLDSSGKPPSWYSRKTGGVRRYACRRECIPADEPVVPW